MAALVSDIKEQFAYLLELGVSETNAGIERAPSSPVASSAAKTAPRPTETRAPAALQRNAVAAAREESRTSESGAGATVRHQAANTVSQTPNAQPNNPRTDTNMAKKITKKTPELETPAPMETLFGTITPKDEASLPRPDETLEDIWNDIGDCTRCPLAEGRTHIVNSEGNRQARLMFVGEAPGADEDAQARPFVGRAGQLLNKIIEAIGMKREDVFIGNVNRCRPPQNRTPTLPEAQTCKPFLLREIAVVRPAVIVVMGNTAMRHLLDTKEGITKVRGKFQDYRGIKVMPTFHPAYLLRDPSKKRETWADMKTVRDYLNSLESDG